MQGGRKDGEAGRVSRELQKGASPGPSRTELEAIRWVCLRGKGAAERKLRPTAPEGEETGSRGGREERAGGRLPARGPLRIRLALLGLHSSTQQRVAQNRWQLNGETTGCGRAVNNKTQGRAGRAGRPPSLGLDMRSLHRRAKARDSGPSGLETRGGEAAPDSPGGPGAIRIGSLRQPTPEAAAPDSPPTPRPVPAESQRRPPTPGTAPEGAAECSHG